MPVEKTRKMEKKLERIAAEFSRMAAKAPALQTLRILARGRKTREARADVVKAESLEHFQHKRALLGKIDQYARLYTRLKGEKLTLPVSMARELEALGIRKTVQIHPDVPRTVAQALERHRSRLQRLFDSAEDLKRAHGISIARLGARRA